LLREERRFETCVVCSSTAIHLRAIHVDDTHLLPRHTEELRYTRAMAVRLHVVGIDRHLPIRRVSQRVGRTNGRVSLKGDCKFCFDDVLGGFKRRVRITLDERLTRRCGGGATHIVEQLAGSGEGRGSGSLPLRLELPCGADGLFFALTNHRYIVAAADYANKAWHIADRGFVDSLQYGSGKRRPDIARMNHAWQFHVYRPPQRSVHLRGDVVSLVRPAHDAQVADGLAGSLAGRQVNATSSERDVEALATDQFGVGHRPVRIGLYKDGGIGDCEHFDGHRQVLAAQFQQYPARFRSYPAHGATVSLHTGRTPRAALVRSDIRAAHDEAGLVI